MRQVLYWAVALYAKRQHTSTPALQLLERLLHRRAAQRTAAQYKGCSNVDVAEEMLCCVTSWLCNWLMCCLTREQLRTLPPTALLLLPLPHANLWAGL